MAKLVQEVLRIICGISILAIVLTFISMNKIPVYAALANVPDQAADKKVHPDSNDISSNAAIIGKPVHTTEEAKEVLCVILQAEGLQATSITSLDQDQSGNYYFSVWYSNFPHNIRIVTHDGYVIEDED